MSINVLPFFVVLPLLVYAVLSYTITVTRFNAQESAERVSDVKKCIALLAMQSKQIATHLRDYAIWDETYNVIKKPNQKWLDDNLTGWIPKQFGIQTVILTDTCLRVVDSTGLDENTCHKLLLSKQFKQAVNGTISKGLLRIGNKVYLIATSPVLHSSGEGPIAGTLTFAKKLDNSVVSEVAGILNLNVLLYIDYSPTVISKRVSLNDIPQNTDAVKSPGVHSGKSIVMISPDKQRVFVWKGLMDWNGCYIAALVTSTSRTEYLANKRASFIRSLILVAVCLFAALLAALQMRSSVLARHAHIDELTGLHNHRFLQERLAQELNRARRYSRPLSIALLDIDHFKYINDEYGHLVGDQALKKLAQLLQGIVRETDFVARYGGEEFLIIMPETPIQPAVAVAERVRHMVEKTVFDVKMAGTRGRSSTRFPLHFTVSLGVASCPTHADQPDELIMAADLALFAAKHASRNAVRSYSSLIDDDLTRNERPGSIHLAMREGSLSTVRALAAAIDARDARMRGHSEKVALFSLAIGHEIGLSNDDMNTLRTAALLHDVGRIAVPDAVHHKPGALSEEEWAIVKSHSIKGEEILSKAPQLTQVAKLVRHHHERYDGKGYPDGISGEDIPLISRIIAVADTFDAMTSDRAHRAASETSESIKRMKPLAGKQFDPNLLIILERLVESGKIAELFNIARDELDKAA